MSRKNFSEEERERVFRRDGGICRRCRAKIVFKNRQRDQFAAWEMGHRRSDKAGGTTHLSNIVALCWPCNLEQGTKSFADSERDMEYNNMGDKMKSRINGIFDNSFDLSGAKRSMSADAELEELRKQMRNNSRDWADKKYSELSPLARRFETTNDPSYKIYYKMCMILLGKS